MDFCPAKSVVRVTTGPPSTCAKLESLEPPPPPPRPHLARSKDFRAAPPPPGREREGRERWRLPSLLPSMQPSSRGIRFERLDRSRKSTIAQLAVTFNLNWLQDTSLTCPSVCLSVDLSMSLFFNVLQLQARRKVTPCRCRAMGLAPTPTSNLCFPERQDWCGGGAFLHPSFHPSLVSCLHF